MQLRRLLRLAVDGARGWHMLRPESRLAAGQGDGQCGLSIAAIKGTSLPALPSIAALPQHAPEHVGGVQEAAAAAAHHQVLGVAQGPAAGLLGAGATRRVQRRHRGKRV